MTDSALTERRLTSLASIDQTAALGLLMALKTAGYRFVTPTPSTHRRVLRHPNKLSACTVEDVLGWSLPFTPDVLPASLYRAMTAAGVIEESGDKLRATIRVSSLGDDLFLHSAFPPQADDAVFFGPDTYRFARFIDERLRNGPPVQVLVDIGTGSGAGAVVAARAAKPLQVVGVDINAAALNIAKINLAAAGLAGSMSLSDGLAKAPLTADLIIANPPFIAGDGGRTYRDGGDMHGARLSLDWTIEGARRLAPGGRLLLYTGAAIVDGEDALLDALRQGLKTAEFALDYQELDPDIFGEMLGGGAYQNVDRIAAIGAVVTRLE